MSSSRPYRSIYESLWDDSRFTALDRDGQHLWFALRFLLGPAGIDAIYLDALEERHQEPGREALEVRLAELRNRGWIEFAWLARRRLLVWMIEALVDEPVFQLGTPNHAKSVMTRIRSLPPHPIVGRFLERHEKYVAKSEAAAWAELIANNAESLNLVNADTTGGSGRDDRGHGGEDATSLRSSDTEGDESRDAPSRRREEGEGRLKRERPTALPRRGRTTPRASGGSNPPVHEQDGDSRNGKDPMSIADALEPHAAAASASSRRKPLPPEIAHDDRLPKIRRFVEAWLTESGKEPAGLEHTIVETGVDHVNAIVTDLLGDPVWKAKPFEDRRKIWNARIRELSSPTGRSL